MTVTFKSIHKSGNFPGREKYWWRKGNCHCQFFHRGYIWTYSFFSRVDPTAANEESRIVPSTSYWDSRRLYNYLLLFLEVIHGRGAAEGKKFCLYHDPLNGKVGIDCAWSGPRMGDIRCQAVLHSSPEKRAIPP